MAGIYHVHLLDKGRGREITGFNMFPGSKGCGDTVDLRSVDPILYPAISADLLQIHASLCQVLHASGAGEAISKILREWEQFRVLPEDGGDASLLSARLSLIHAC